MSQEKIAVVTGTNRGIGSEVARELAQKGLTVVATARDEKKGKALVKKLNDEGLKNVVFHQLDVNDQKSVNKLKSFLEKEYGRCDVLVNNAGIFPDTKDASDSNWPSILETNIDTINKAMTTNVYGPILLSQAIVPLMKRHGYGRIVNLSSGMGQLTFMNGHCPGYRISKTSINAVTRILAEELRDTNVLVNSMCPGWVKTDMGGPGATRSLKEGADTAIFLATLPDDGPTGLFFRDRKEFPW